MFEELGNQHTCSFFFCEVTKTCCAISVDMYVCVYLKEKRLNEPVLKLAVTADILSPRNSLVFGIFSRPLCFSLMSCFLER